MTSVPYPTRPARRRSGSRILFAVAVIFALIGAAPLISAGIAQAIADGHGCALDEGSVHVCMVAGSDWGRTLATMAVMGWLALLTVWLLLAAPVVFVIGLIVRASERKGDVQ